MTKLPEWWPHKKPYAIMDCIEGMRKLPDNFIDLVVTDPPYNLGKDYGKTSNDNMKSEDYWAWFREVFTEVYRIMKTGYLYMSHSDKGVYEAKNILEGIGFKYVQTLIWWGKNGYSMQLSRRTWSYRHEPILFMRKEKPEQLLAGEKGMWYTSVIDATRPQSNFREGRVHPTQKPIKLYQILIQRTPGMVVFDPFLGSGTTLLACINISRDGFGFEINPDYKPIIEQRIVEATRQAKARQRQTSLMRLIE